MAKIIYLKPRCRPSADAPEECRPFDWKAAGLAACLAAVVLGLLFRKEK